MAKPAPHTRFLTLPARLDLERLRCHPYLPQCRKFYRPAKTTVPLVRSYPLFSGYLFLPLADARSREIHYCRGLRLPKPLLEVGDRLWVAPDDAVLDEVARLEHRGDLDETLLVDNRSRLHGVEMFLAQVAEQTAELFRPLWAVARPVEMQAAE